jgi:hypothetical protein
MSAPKVPDVVVDLLIKVGAKVLEELAEALLRNENPAEAAMRATRHAAIRETGNLELDELQKVLGKP